MRFSVIFHGYVFFNLRGKRVKLVRINQVKEAVELVQRLCHGSGRAQIFFEGKRELLYIEHLYVPVGIYDDVGEQVRDNY